MGFSKSQESNEGTHRKALQELGKKGLTPGAGATNEATKAYKLAKATKKLTLLPNELINHTVILLKQQTTKDKSN